MPQFTDESVRRIAAVVKTVEREPVNTNVYAAREITRSSGRRAIVTAAITPPTSSTATHSLSHGWGFAQLQRYDPTLNKFVNLGDPVKVINPWPATTTTATAGKVIWVHFVDGVWMMIGENCS